MSAVRIGLISDTHGLLRNQVKQLLQSCDLILHAGDIGNPQVLQELTQIAPTTAVRGNVDVEPWANSLKITERLNVGKWSIALVHNIDDLILTTEQADLVVFGHSHRFLEEKRDGILLINPGNAGPRRFILPITMAILTLDDKATVEKVVLKNKA
ncbi:MAG: metallophosphoesterase family protein [Firmicutes bacterium]|nr:metallophosphoesterase family protein [Bacillota bacterium]